MLLHVAHGSVSSLPRIAFREIEKDHFRRRKETESSPGCLQGWQEVSTPAKSTRMLSPRPSLCTISVRFAPCDVYMVRPASASMPTACGYRSHHRLQALPFQQEYHPVLRRW